MKVIFMGSPDFAIPALKALLNSDHEVVAVYTQGPRKKNRGHKVLKTSVNILADEHNIPVFTPHRLRDEIVIEEFNNIEADIVVVVAYGLILPKIILEGKKFGCLNIHPSSLPKFRGAAPLQWTILSGDDHSSVCVMKMDTGVDTGPILYRKDFVLEPDINFIELHDFTSQLGGEMLLEVLNNFENFTALEQTNENSSYAPKLNKEDGLITGNETCKEVDRKVRALWPSPGTYFEHNDENIKISAIEYKEISHQYTPGTIIDKQFTIAVIDGLISPLKLQRPGKKMCDIKEFLKGYKF